MLSGRTIFGRLFLGFAVTVVVAGLISGLIIYSLSHDSIQGFRDDFHSRLVNNVSRTTVLMGRAAYIVFENRDLDAFLSYLREVEDSMRTELFLVVEDTVYPQDKELLPELQQLVLSAQAGGQMHIKEDGHRVMVARFLFTPDGIGYTVAGIHRLFPPPPGAKGEPPHPDTFSIVFFPGTNLLVYTVVFILITGLVCYFLARSFSSPINRLRSASKKIASGDLTARIGKGLGGAGKELSELGHDFDFMADRLEELVLLQKRLLLDISHELRSPLSRMGVALELVRSDNGDQRGRMLDKMEKELRRLNELIGQLLRLTKFEQGQLEIERVKFDLVQLVNTIAEDVSFELEKSGKGVKRMGSSEKIQLCGSEEQIRQAIENVVRNAAQFTAAGTAVEVDLAVRGEENNPGEAVITVRDFGPGIPAKELELVLEPFYRVSSARERQGLGSGVGIGLAIANQAVKLHGGCIVLGNCSDGTGLRVRISLPLCP